MKKRLCFLAGFLAVGGLMIGCGNQAPNAVSTGKEGRQPAQAITMDGYFQLRNGMDSSKTLDLDNTGGIKNGSKVHLWTGFGTLNQQWKFVLLSNGYYKIVSRANEDLCLDADISSGPIGNGTKIIVWQYVGNENQMWQISSPTGSALTISAKSNTNLVLDADNTYAAGGMLPDGTKVQLWTSVGGANQRWFAQPTW